MNSLLLENTIHCVIRRWNESMPDEKLNVKYQFDQFPRRMEARITSKKGNKIFISTIMWTEEEEAALVIDLREHYKRTVLENLLMEVFVAGIGGQIKYMRDPNIVKMDGESFWK